MEALRRSFRPEFLNRIDEIVIFNPLRRADIDKIIDIQIDLIKKRLQDEHRIKLDIDPAAREYLAKEGFSAEFGARPLKRMLQKVILDRLADKIIRGECKDGGKVKVNFKANALVFSS
jgi:ATP-dependent Clp protease ATP-binding subunit ClpB